MVLLLFLDSEDDVLESDEAGVDQEGEDDGLAQHAVVHRSADEILLVGLESLWEGESVGQGLSQFEEGVVDLGVGCVGLDVRYLQGLDELPEEVIEPWHLCLLNVKSSPLQLYLRRIPLSAVHIIILRPILLHQGISLQQEVIVIPPQSLVQDALLNVALPEMEGLQCHVLLISLVLLEDLQEDLLPLVAAEPGDMSGFEDIQEHLLLLLGDLSVFEDLDHSPVTDLADVEVLEDLGGDLELTEDQAFLKEELHSVEEHLFELHHQMLPEINHIKQNFRGLFGGFKEGEVVGEPEPHRVQAKVIGSHFDRDIQEGEVSLLLHDSCEHISPNLDVIPLLGESVGVELRGVVSVDLDQVHSLFCLVVLQIQDLQELPENQLYIHLGGEGQVGFCEVLDRHHSVVIQEYVQ